MQELLYSFSKWVNWDRWKRAPDNAPWKLATGEVRLPARPQGIHRVSEEAAWWDMHACTRTCGTPSQSSACCMASRALSTGFRGSQDSQSGHRPVNSTQKMLLVLTDWRGKSNAVPKLNSLSLLREQFLPKILVNCMLSGPNVSWIWLCQGRNHSAWAETSSGCSSCIQIEIIHSLMGWSK